MSQPYNNKEKPNSIIAKDEKQGKRSLGASADVFHHQNEDILSAIINSSDDAIIRKTADDIIVTWNPAATRIFGYSAEEAIGREFSLIVPEERLQEEAVMAEQIRQGKKIDHFNTLRISKDGSYKNISLSVSPLYDDTGKVIGAYSIARDVDSRNLADEKQAMLAAIVSSSEDAIVSKTLDGVITSWNQSAVRMFGYSEQEAIGNHITIIIPPDRLKEETMIIETIRSGKSIEHFETVRRRKDGTMVDLSVTVSPIKNNAGQIIGASKSARDITMRLEAERTLQLYNERLQELVKYKDEFMIMASHELKTPVTVILANLQLVQMQMGEDSVHIPFVTKALRQVQKLSDLITKLLDVSKVQAGRLLLNVTSFDMAALIAEISSDMQKTATEYDLQFLTPEPLMVSADKERLEQALANLISNAIKYSEVGDVIEISCYVEHEKLVVRVKDNGIGIPNEELQNIFLRFYRVSGTASSFSGLGVGLYITSQIINAHGGDIWAESELGKGATFYFSLPLKPAGEISASKELQ